MWPIGLVRACLGLCWHTWMGWSAEFITIDGRIAQVRQCYLCGERELRYLTEKNERSGT